MAHQTVSDAQPLVDDCADVPSPEPGTDCPVEITMAALSGRWTALVIRTFLVRPDQSYGDVAAALPRISDKVLGERLSQLRDAGVLRRTRVPGWPPRVR